MQSFTSVGLERLSVILLLGTAALLGGGCAVTPGSEQDRGRDDGLTQGVDTSQLWQSKTVAYCFEHPQLQSMPGSVRASVASQADLDQRWARRKQEFIDAINATWQSVGVLNIVPQDGCTSGAVVIHYSTDTPTGGYAGLGPSGGLSTGVQMDSEFLGETYPWGENTYHTFVAAHEFGHVLGFRHEQDRQDSTCHVSQDFSGVGIQLTGYDASSIMNYCNSQQTVLTDLDKQGFRKAYSFLGGGGGDQGGGSTGGGGGQCTDSNASCAAWASSGECSKNPGYMLTNCCASCKANQGGACTDSNASCAAWASSGECSKNPGYMLTNCCASCNANQGGACTDSNANCAYWASIGECSRNPGYMLTNCCASCKQ